MQASSPIHELLEALKHDNLVQLRKLLAKASIDLNEATITCDQYEIDDPDEIPLLFWVIQSHVSREAIEILIDQGMQFDATSREGLGALDIAIKHHRRDIVELCGEQGISYRQSQRRSGLTPLMLAASFSDFDMVDFLLDNGASVHDTDKRGTSAAEYARVLGQTKMAEYLGDIARK